MGRAGSDPGPFCIGPVPLEADDASKLQNGIEYARMGIIRAGLLTSFGLAAASGHSPQARFSLLDCSPQRRGSHHLAVGYSPGTSSRLRFRLTYGAGGLREAALAIHPGTVSAAIGRAKW